MDEFKDVPIDKNYAGFTFIIVIDDKVMFGTDDYRMAKKEFKRLGGLCYKMF